MDVDMVEQLNYGGATIFWLYIVAALALTTIILQTLIDLHPAGATRSDDKAWKVKLFSSLAAISFATLSYNMLNVLIQSYTLWAHERELSLTSTSSRDIWQWSITSTLFQDFGNAIVKGSVRYLWVEAELLATLCACLFIGIEGQHRRVPRLWAFISLGQILPISFTQNLFYVALLRQSEQPVQWHVSRMNAVVLSGAYCACLIVAPVTAETEWLIPQILIARFLLVAMQVCPWNTNDSSRESTAKANDASLDRDGLARHLALLASLCGFAQASLALLEESPKDVGRALFDDPAVSSLGCDFVLSIISYLCWRSISSAQGEPGKSSPRTNLDGKEE